MLKKIIGNLQTIAIAIIDHEIKSSVKKFVYKDFGIRLYDQNKSDTIVILMHGFSGNQDASYINSMIDKLVDKNINVLTFDMAGNNESIQHPKFWGSGTSDQVLDPIFEWVQKQDRWKYVFPVAFSAAGGYLLTYLCYDEKISNEHSKIITYSFFVSPSIKHKKMLKHIRSKIFPIYTYAMSFSHTINLVKHRLYHKKFLEIPHIIKNCTFDALYSNLYGSGKNKIILDYKIYKKIKGLAIYAEDDPILLPEDMNEYKNYCEIKTVTFGGHVAFYNLDGSREHENIIFKKIKEIIEQDQYE